MIELINFTRDGQTIAYNDLELLSSSNGQSSKAPLVL